MIEKCSACNGVGFIKREGEASGEPKKADDELTLTIREILRAIKQINCAGACQGMDMKQKEVNHD